MNDVNKYHEYNFTNDDTEQDFYCLLDNRFWTSNVDDIDGGDNFADYCNEFFEMLDEEEYYDN